MNIKYLLFYRWLCVNFVGFALLSAAHTNGWIQIVISSDPTNIVLVITATFLWGLAVCGLKVWETSRELNFIHGNHLDKSCRWLNFVRLKKEHAHQDPTGLIEALKIRQFSKISFVKYIASSLVIMGLIGTVLGFIIALGGVDPAVVTDATAIAPMVATLLQGMYTALYTTLVGSILSVWLTINYYILAGGTAKLVTAILETTEYVE